MPEKLTPETADRIRALCRQISVAHSLDEEIQRELFSHMEDKLLGYLSGEEKVTEEDALILVREHFGKPEVINGMFREVHAVEVGLSSFRALAAYVAALLGSVIFLMIAWSLLNFAFWLSSKGHSITDSSRIIMGIPVQGLIIVFYLTLWTMLLKWKREMLRGVQPWFNRVGGFTFFGILLTLVLVAGISTILNQGMIDLAGLIGLERPDATALMLHDIFNWIAVWSNVFLYLSLIWWLDGTPGKPSSFLEGVWLSFILYVVLFAVSTLMTTTPEKYLRTMAGHLFGADMLRFGIAAGLYFGYVTYKNRKGHKAVKPFFS